MSDDLQGLVADLERLDDIVATWDETQRATVQAVRTTLEAIQAEAFRRIIREVKQTSEGLASLRAAVEDPWVYSVLTYHGLLAAPEPPVEDRIRTALKTVQPMLEGHQGGVELVAFVEPDEAQIRLLGSCNGCAFSDATVKLGIERALVEQVAEVERVTVVRGVAPAQSANVAGSPFAVPWEDAIAASEVPDGGVVAVELERASVLLTRVDGEVKAYPNACAHLGMPLEMGEIADGVLTCSYHGFRFLLSTGECLTAPEIGLMAFPVQVSGERVQVRVTT
ncbi:MAG: NifU family protein [Myxococcota bacterium]